MALTLGAAGAGHAAGFYLQDQSARASGYAFSGEVADLGAASLWWNPAAIAGIERSELEASATPVLVEERISDAGSTLSRFGLTRPVGGQPNAFKPLSR